MSNISIWSLASRTSPGSQLAQRDCSSIFFIVNPSDCITFFDSGNLISTSSSSFKFFTSFMPNTSTLASTFTSNFTSSTFTFTLFTLDTSGSTFLLLHAMPSSLFTVDSSFTLFTSFTSGATSFTLFLAETCSIHLWTSTSASSSLPPSSSSHSSSLPFSLVADSRYSSALSTTCSVMSVSTFHSYPARRTSSGCLSFSNGGPQPARAQYLALAWLNSFQAASTWFLVASISRRLSFLASSTWHLLIAAVKTLSLLSRVFLAWISFDLLSCAWGSSPILSLVPFVLIISCISLVISCISL